MKQWENKYEELEHQQKELVYKFECNEKYWSQKCAMLEKEATELSESVQSREEEIKKLKREMSYSEEQKSEAVKQKNTLMEKKEKKDSIILELQSKISELIQDNSQLSRQAQAK